MADGSVIINVNLDNKGLDKDTKEAESKLKSVFGKIGSTAGAGLSKLGSMASSALKGATVAIGATATALTGLGVASVKSYADLEQNVGGIETLFKGSANKVIKNAENAYKTAGMSANEYMETVTSFSASLLQSLGGDTEKAAASADMAITDMADNANKMGTSMELIQNAYQGFAKQNYTMLDNLKLGYGGTKEEMERLLADAEKISGIKYDISNLNDVYSAIHVIQGELGITGTTAKEASETISGSFASMKASLDNFLNGSGTIDQFIDSLTVALQNVIKAVEKLLPSIVQSIAAATPTIVNAINQIFPQIIGVITENLPTIVSSIIQVLENIIDTLLAYAPQLIPVAVNLIQSFIMGLLTYLPQIIQVGIQLITEFIQGIASMMPQLVPLAIQAINTLIQGLIQAIPLLVPAIMQIIQAFITVILESLPQILQLGITYL